MDGVYSDMSLRSIVLQCLSEIGEGSIRDIVEFLNSDGSRDVWSVHVAEMVDECRSRGEIERWKGRNSHTLYSLSEKGYAALEHLAKPVPLFSGQDGRRIRAEVFHK